jgi:hypothetical protein
MSPSSYRTASAPLDSFDTASDDARAIVIDRPNAPRTNAPRVPPRAIVVARDGVFRIVVVVVVAMDRSTDSPASSVARTHTRVASPHDSALPRSPTRVEVDVTVSRVTRARRFGRGARE